MKKLLLIAAAFSAALTLSACGGGGGGDQSFVAARDATLALNPTTGVTNTNAVRGQAFTFPSGVAEFGTSASTNVTFQERTATTLPDNAVPAGNPAFTITSGGQTATGLVEFGSCIFRVQSSSFTSGPLVAGAIITIQRCEIALGVAGTPADGVVRARSARLLLNAAISGGLTVQVSITPGGQITLNGFSVGTVTVTPVTGA